MYELTGKTVFITGAAQGLGKLYAERVLEKGAKVFLGDINATAGENTEQELKDQFGKDNVRFHPFDVSDNTQFEDGFRLAVSHFGHIDVMVNNAGILNEGVWELMIQINYTATVLGTKLALDHMRKDKGGAGGRIVNISSIMGFHDHYSQPVYCGTKHAVRSFTSALAMQPDFVAETSVEMACLCPDAASTDLVLRMDESKVFDYSGIKDKIDARIMEPSTVAEAFMKLISLEDMNGALLLVSKTSQDFHKLQPVNLGSTWPPPKPSM